MFHIDIESVKVINVHYLIINEFKLRNLKFTLSYLQLHCPEVVGGGAGGPKSTWS